MNRIKEARIAAGLSQKYVATTLGVSGPSVSNWESGKTTPTTENLASLSALFGVSVDYLLGQDIAIKTGDKTPEYDDTRKYIAENLPKLNDKQAKTIRMIMEQMRIK